MAKISDINSNIFQALKAWLKSQNSSYNLVGFADQLDSTPPATLNNAYLCVETGTVFGKSVTIGQLLVGTGSDFEMKDIKLKANHEDLVRIEGDVNSYNVTHKHPLTAGNYYTLATAIAAVPTNVKKSGLTIRFEVSASSWKVYQFLDQVANFSKITCWRDMSPVFDYVEVSGTPEAQNGYYNKGTGVFAAFAECKSKKYDIVQGQDYYVTSRSLGTNLALAVYYDSTGNWIAYENAADPSTAENFVRERLLSIPATATKVGLSSYDTIYPRLEKLNINIIKDVEKLKTDTTALDTRTQLVEEKSKINANVEGVAEAVDGYYDGDDGIFHAYIGIKSKKFEIDPLNNYYLTSRVFGAQSALATYLDKESNWISCEKRGNNTADIVYTNEKLNVPVNAKYLLTSNHSTAYAVLAQDGLMSVNNPYVYHNIAVKKTLLGGVRIFDFATRTYTGNIAVIGDSTIAAYLGGAALSSFLVCTGTKTDISSPGATIANELAFWNALTPAVKAAVNYAFVQIGLNDLNPAETAATALERYQSLITQITIDAPDTVIMCGTMTPCKSRLISLYGVTDGLFAHQKWQDMNTAILTKTITGIDLVSDVHTTLLSDTEGNLATEYNAATDGIHENTKARRIIAYSWIIAE